MLYFGLVKAVEAARSLKNQKEPGSAASLNHSGRLLRRCRALCSDRPEVEVEAELVLDDSDGAAWLHKHCPEHGLERAMVARSGWYLEGLDDYYYRLNPGPSRPDPRRLSGHVLYLTTMRCNFRCPVCFLELDREKELTESIEAPSLDQIRELVGRFRGWRAEIFPLGAEPTMRPELPEIIALIRRSGNYPVLVSNGERLRDARFFRCLVDAGLSKLVLSIDALADPQVEQQFRGRQVERSKFQVLELARKFGLPVQLERCMARGINDDDLNAHLRLARGFPMVHNLVYRSYLDVGSCSSSFSREHQLLPDEIVEALGRANPELAMRDFYVFQKLIYALCRITGMPRCHRTQALFVPRDAAPPLAEVLDFETLEPILERFAEDTPAKPRRAAASLLAWLGRRLVHRPDLLYVFGLQGLRRFSYPERHYPNSYLSVCVSSLYDAATYHATGVWRCHSVWHHGGKPEDFEPFCKVILDSSRFKRRLLHYQQSAGRS